MYLPVSNLINNVSPGCSEENIKMKTNSNINEIKTSDACLDYHLHRSRFVREGLRELADSAYVRKWESRLVNMFLSMRTRIDIDHLYR
jgi:hypothetical protein